MCEYLPTKNFKWNTDEWIEGKILNLSDTAAIAYWFSVDLSLDESLYPHFNNYPLCPESMAIKEKDLDICQQRDIRKICSTFHDKKNHVVSYRYWKKLALLLGYSFAINSVRFFKPVYNVIYQLQKAFRKRLSTKFLKASK